LELGKKKENGVMVVNAKGRVDGVNAHELENCLSEIIEEGTGTIILDLAELKYISSAGLRVILTTVKKLKAQKRELFLSGLKGPVENVFKISGFGAILKIFDTPEQAMENS
jgi:anti-anti-sigma factor